MVINLVLNKQAKAPQNQQSGGDYVIEGNSILNEKFCIGR
jgi:hypothetical protein